METKGEAPGRGRPREAPDPPRVPEGQGAKCMGQRAEGGAGRALS